MKLLQKKKQLHFLQIIGNQNLEEKLKLKFGEIGKNFNWHNKLALLAKIKML